MTWISRKVKRRLLLALAVAAVAVGGILAGLAAADGSTGTSTPRNSARMRHTRHAHARTRDGRTSALAVAARYLGVSRARLDDELAARRTLAQIADATSGRSAAGLTEAIYDAQAAWIDAVAAGGKLSGTARARRLSRLHRRVVALVDRAHPKAGARYATVNLKAASRYLGLSVAELRGDTRAGRSLARIAGETPGKSEAGLLDALVAAERGKLAAAVAKR